MKPVQPSERISSVDILRGAAVLGILLMNVVSLSLPDPAYWDPSGHGGNTGWDLKVFIINALFIEGSFRSIFSMLFGAGVILFTVTREEHGGGLEIADAWYRRTIWLILFGMVHAYFLIFPGEILFYYGIAGLFLFPVRKSSPARLVMIATFVFMILAIIRIADYRGTLKMYEETVAAEELISAGQEISPEQSIIMGKWYYKLAIYKPSEVSRENTISSMRYGYLKAFRTMAPYVRFMQTEYFYRTGFLDALGMMLLGMAFFKWRIFHAEKSFLFYGVMGVLGYGIGIPLNWYETSTYMNSQFDLITYFRMNQTYDLGRIAIALGHIGLVMICSRLNFMKVVKSAMAAVGRMALTNYVMHTFIALIIFVLFKQYGQWQRHELCYLVLGIWVFQLITSPLWLSYFSHGPLEWFWRRLTYGGAFLKHQ